MHKRKKKNRTYARYRWREKHRKQYTFTKTKFVVGFFVSVLTSVFLGSYFDKYGSIVLHQVFDAAESALEDSSAGAENAVASSDTEASGQENADESTAKPLDIERINERVKAVTITPVELKPRKRARLQSDTSSASGSRREDAYEMEKPSEEETGLLNPQQASQILREQPIFVPIPAASSR